MTSDNLNTLFSYQKKKSPNGQICAGIKKKKSLQGIKSMKEALFQFHVVSWSPQERRCSDMPTLSF